MPPNTEERPLYRRFVRYMAIGFAITAFVTLIAGLAINWALGGDFLPQASAEGLSFSRQIDGQSLVGLFALWFAVPVALAGAIVVVELGDRQHHTETLQAVQIVTEPLRRVQTEVLEMDRLLREVLSHSRSLEWDLHNIKQNALEPDCLVDDPTPHKLESTLARTIAKVSTLWEAVRAAGQQASLLATHVGTTLPGVELKPLSRPEEWRSSIREDYQDYLWALTPSNLRYPIERRALESALSISSSCPDALYIVSGLLEIYSSRVRLALDFFQEISGRPYQDWRELACKLLLCTDLQALEELEDRESITLIMERLSAGNRDPDFGLFFSATDNSDTEWEYTTHVKTLSCAIGLYLNARDALDSELTKPLEVFESGTLPKALHNYLDKVKRSLSLGSVGDPEGAFSVERDVRRWIQVSCTAIEPDDQENSSDLTSSDVDQS